MNVQLAGFILRVFFKFIILIELIMRFFLIFIFTAITSIFLITSCKDEKERVDFDESKLLSFDSLIKTDRFFSFSEAFAAKDTVYKIILYDRGLSTFPSDFKKLKYLNVLEITRNKFTDLPDMISGFMYLQAVYADQNLFEEIPDAIFDIPHLKRLSLSDNSISSIPKKINKLKEIEHLIINRNQISKIPDHISELKSLKLFKFNNNGIEEIDFSFEDLQNLEVIDLSNNNLKELPEGLDKLPNIKSIDLFKNQIPIDQLMELRKSLPKSVNLKF